MKTLDDILASAQPARLIPTVADSRKEERIVSILLATLPNVRPFAEQLLERCGQRLSKSSVLKTYAEVDFPSADGSSSDRPDGLLCLTTRKTRWTAMLEAKIDNSDIEPEQIYRYADLAKRFQVDAIITLSNQLVPIPTHVPYPLHKRVSNQAGFFHFSWTSILTYAQLILRNKGVLDPQQRFILSEVAQYMDQESSGVRRFERMNSEWRTLVFGIRDGQQFKRTSPEIERTVASWHQEERDICLILSRLIGEQVGIRRLSRKHQADPTLRLREACDALVSTKRLRATFGIPNAANDLEVAVDLQRRTISCSMKLDAPKDRQRASARINWLRRQLRSVDSDGIIVRAIWPGRALSTQAMLSDVKVDSKYLENDRSGIAPNSFEVVMIRDIGGRFPGRKTFIEDLEKMVPEFYDKVGQHLRPWTPPPPKIDKRDPIHDREAAGEGERRGDDDSPLERREFGGPSRGKDMGSSASNDPHGQCGACSPDNPCTPSTT